MSKQTDLRYSMADSDSDVESVGSNDSDREVIRLNIDQTNLRGGAYSDKEKSDAFHVGSKRTWCHLSPMKCER